jgi:hypothetical protein
VRRPADQTPAPPPGRPTALTAAANYLATAEGCSHAELGVVLLNRPASRAYACPAAGGAQRMACSARTWGNTATSYMGMSSMWTSAACASASRPP